MAQRGSFENIALLAWRSATKRAMVVGKLDKYIDGRCKSRRNARLGNQAYYRSKWKAEGWMVDGVTNSDMDMHAVIGCTAAQA